MFPFCINFFLGFLLILAPVNGQSAAAKDDLVQQDFEAAPPFPILSIGMEHIVSELIANGTDFDIASITDINPEQSSFARPNPLADIAPIQCAPGRPCTDGSCCNTEGQCGFTDYHCKRGSATTCISNCGATAMCGKHSLDGQQHCPFGLCCSYSGYCGTTGLYCNNMDSTGLSQACQQGYGNCRVVPPPSCGTPTTSNGRKVGYYQAGNIVWRRCNQVRPSQIDITGLTHLIFAFASIDPYTFKITPRDRGDPALYSEFTALKSAKLQTWIAVGGFSFNDPGPTHTTWSDMVSNQNNRASFISSMIQFMDKFGFQGMDIDWEFPGFSDRGGKESDLWGLVLLVREMRQAFGNKYGISIALPNDFYYLQKYDVVAMEPWLTFINFMTYDMHGPWEAQRLGSFIRPQTSIIDIKKVAVPLWFSGLNPFKINLGMAYYGRGYTASNSDCVNIGCPYSGDSLPGQCTNSPGIMSLSEIKKLIQQKNLTPKLIPEDMIKQIAFDNQWIGYDDTETIALKSLWADQHCLGGIAIWSVDFNSDTGSAASTESSPQAPSSSASDNDNPPSAGMRVSKDGTCGGATMCRGSPFGECCSRYGWCGRSRSHCDISAGCQCSFGTCR